jgi:uncharacterized DUF497 family protein
MKVFAWNEEKNRWLIATRGVSFDDVMKVVKEQGYFESICHINPKRYPNQRIMLVRLHGYIYLVPFVKVKEKYFLKTIYPSRKLTVLYRNLRKEGYDKTKTRL